MPVIKITELNLKNKRVFIRSDLNVPIKNGVVTSDARITASMSTINYCLEQGAKVMVTSHLGRPEEGIWSEENSLKPVADNISARLNKPVHLIKDWVEGGFEVKSGDLVVLENCRFNKGEKKNTEETAQKYAKLCDVFVMDAFGTAHRAQASTHGIAKYAPVACAGILLTEELEALTKALLSPARPMVAIVGGSKVSTKLTVLESLSEKVDQLVVGGGIANTFLKATGKNIGKSLCEDSLVSTAKNLMDKMEIRNASIPIAVFEFDQFGSGTKTIATAIANTKAFTLAGGGDTIAAIQKYDIYDKISYISTAGGAFLEFLEGKKLPAVEILEERAN